MPIPDKIVHVAEEVDVIIEAHAEPTRASLARWLRKLKDAIAEEDAATAKLGTTLIS